MKPAVFDYRRAASMDEAVALLREYGTDAKVLAGGQSLLPMMKLRLARPRVVVDLGRAAGLDYVRADGDGLAFGAMARLVELESARVGQRCPMLTAAAHHIGHPPIRHRGTVCGSLAQADPAAELPALALALDAELVAVGPGGRRVIPAERFFVTYLTTDLAPDEVLAEVRFPLGGEAWGFQELSRRFGDYAMAAAATVLVTARDGKIMQARIALAGEIKTRAKRNVVQARSFTELLEQSLRRYQNRAIETARVIEELIQLAKDMRQASQRGEALGLTDDEVAFYDALETNDSAVKVLGDEALRTIARELVATVRANVTIDWTVRENVRAQLRVLVKRILRKHGYPPDKQEKATQTVLEQAEVLSQEWAAA